MKKLIHFFKNIWIFRKLLWKHRWWDYGFTLLALKTSLEVMEKGMHAGNEVRESRDKKIVKIQRAIEILQHLENADYMEMAENRLGKRYFYADFDLIPHESGGKELLIGENLTKGQKKINSQLREIKHEIEEKEWNELWDILRGQDYSKFNKVQDWNEQFDGTGLRNWWD